jgi:hypothetical protein
MTVAHASSFFNELPSQCCNAFVVKHTCAHCLKPVARPYYFLSDRPIEDDLLVELEQNIRTNPDVTLTAQVSIWVDQTQDD